MKGVCMCLAMEKKAQRDKITGAIEAMKILGVNDNDIVSKIVENFNVTKEYVLELLVPQKA